MEENTANLSNLRKISFIVRVSSLWEPESTSNCIKYKQIRCVSAFLSYLKQHHKHEQALHLLFCLKSIRFLLSHLLSLNE